VWGEEREGRGGANKDHLRRKEFWKREKVKASSHLPPPAAPQNKVTTLQERQGGRQQASEQGGELRGEGVEEGRELT